MGWSKSSLNLKGPKGDTGSTGATGAAGTTTWAGITDKPATIAAGATKADALAAIDAEYTGNKGQANGYAGLDGAGKVPVAQLPNSIMEYQGMWNAATNTPTLADGTGSTGDVYRVSVSGIRNLGSGNISFTVSDYAIYNGSTWEKADTTDAVSSVNSLSGDVTLTASSVGAEPAITAGTTAQYFRGDKTFQTLNKAAVGLGNVDNTADANKAVSSASTLTTARLIDGQSFNGSADITVIAPGTFAATAKATPADADVIPLVDTAALNVLKKLSWSNIKAALKTYFDSVATALSNKDLTDPTNTFPTFNQNTTGSAGSAAKWTTARNLAGNSVDGSANVAFANKFVVQGTTDTGLSGAQFLGALGTGIVKNTTTTGVLSIAVAGDFPTLNQNTTGTAANVTGTVAIGNGGTGQTTAQAALNALTGTQTAGRYVRSDGANASLSAIQAGDVPTLNQSTTGSAATLTNGRTFLTNLASTVATSFDGSANNTHGVTGTLPVANGGTGATTLTGLLVGNGTGAFTAVTAPTGTVVGTTDQQTLTQKTLTTPKIATIQDANGNTIFNMPPVASAVNYIYTSNAITGNNPAIGAQGSDANVGLGLVTQGTGVLQLFRGGGHSTIQAAGSYNSGNINLDLRSQGTGVVQANGIAIPTISSTDTLTNKRVTPRINSTASSATPAINTDTTDQFNITALAAAITSMTSSLTGTPTDGQKLLIRIKDNGTARAITWGTSFTSGPGTLLTTTVINKTHLSGFIYDSVAAKWVCVAADANGY